MIRYVDSKRNFQNMNKDKRFYPSNYTKEDIEKEFLKRRINMGNYFGFDAYKMFMPDERDANEYLLGNGGKIGSYFALTEDYCEANPLGFSDIKEDILIISEKVKGVVAGYPVADCPVIIISDLKKKVSAVSHCSAKLIDAKLPMMIADSLKDFCNSADEDLFVYVSACAGEGYIYQNYPLWIRNEELWSEAITFSDEVFKINMRKVLLKEFIERNIKTSQIYFNLADTITDDEHYSNFASSPKGLNIKEKSGRQFIGAFYEDKNKVLVKK